MAGDTIGITPEEVEAITKIVHYEVPRRVTDYCNIHNIQTTLEEIPTRIASEAVRNHFIEATVKNPVSDDEFDEAYSKHRKELIGKCYNYFDRNNLDAIFYPTMPMLPFKLEDWKGPKLKGIHNGKEV